MRCGRRQEKLSGGVRSAASARFQQLGDHRIVWLQFAIPFPDFGLLPGKVLFLVAFLAGVLDAELLIEGRPGDGDAMVGSGKAQMWADPAMLQEWHVAACAEASGGAGSMMGMRLRRDAFACVATRALPVIESAGEWSAEDIAILLRVWVMTIDATHRAVQVTVAVEMVALIAKGADAAIRGVGILELGKFDREKILQRIPRQVRSFTNNFLGGMTLKANHKRLIFVHGREWFHAEVGHTLEAGPADDLDVRLARTVAGLAVNGQAGVMSLVFARIWIELSRDLAAVAILAIGKIRHRSQHSSGRPIGQIGSERNLIVKRHPSQVASQLNEPEILLPDEIEGEKSYRAVVELMKKELRAASVHLAAANHVINADDQRWQAGFLENELIFPLRIDARCHARVLEAHRLAIEAGDDFHLTWISAGTPVGRLLPQLVLFFMTLRASLRADKILERRTPSRQNQTGEQSK